MTKRRGRIRLALMALATAALVAVTGLAPATAAPQTVTNGTQFLTTQGQPIHGHGAGLLKVGQYYYWVGQSTDADNRFISVPLYRSTDFKNWEFRGDILTKNSAPELNVSTIERPKLVYNAATQKYVLWMHWENGQNYWEGRVAVATSSTIDGSYAYQGSFRPQGYESRDMTVYQDDDGSAYLFSSTAIPTTNASTAIFKLNASYTNVESFQGLHWENQSREAPTIFKRNGVYFALSSGTTGWSPNQNKYSTATKITGPWSTPTDFGGPTGNRSQPTYVATISGSAGTSYLYMGDRWAGANNGAVNDSSYVWQPLQFPSNTSVAMPEVDGVVIDTAAGTVNAAPALPRSTIKSASSGLCVNVADDSTATGSKVVQWTCGNGSNAVFARASAGGYVQFQTQHSGLCLAQSGSSGSGGALVQAPCTSGQTSQWQVSGQTIVNRASGACLDVPDESTTAGRQLGTWSCNGGNHQKWSFVA
ncbi:RICIN domain-containing protein [Rathayibacter sp. VKM Ac-2926]|uniref:RICIN domain-containing protein n=1 Tax=Rathayibacter sp. VKM Ac-2926 TaxID=2929477 RepID=UPI001FB38995|nr:RICIN domain-containing protein [Rathayibacter sp. VKM Ac-2926]